MRPNYFIGYDSPDLESIEEDPQWNPEFESEEEFVDPPSSGYLSDDPTLGMARVIPFEKHVLRIMKQPPPYFHLNRQQIINFCECPWLCELKVFSRSAFEMLKIRLSDINFHIVKLRHESTTSDLGVVHDTFTMVLTLKERHSSRHHPFDHHPLELLCSYGAVWAHFEILISPVFSLMFDASLRLPCSSVLQF